MAREGPISSRFIAAIERIIPKRYLKRYDLLLYSAGIDFKASEYITISIIMGVIGGAVAFILFGTLSSALIAFLGVFLGFLYVYPNFRIAKRIEEMEKALPDAFFYLAGSLRAGVSFSEALEELATAKFGALTAEFRRTVAEMKRGRPTVDALRAFALRNKKSPIVYRSMMIVIEALERGAPMADVLVSVGNDVREILRIKKERKASTGMQMMFFLTSGGFVGPMIVAIVSRISEFVNTSGMQVQLPSGELKLILWLFSVIQGFVTGVGIGVIREGKFSAGLRYGVLIAIMAGSVFWLGTRFNIGF
nr:type II secretion system F family protein [Pyrococcus abyssi]